MELLREDGERDREHDCAADALDAAGEVEEEGRGGRAASGRGSGEEHDAADEDPLPPEQVAQGAGVQHAGGEQQGVGVHDPLQIREGGVQLFLNVGEGDVDDSDVQ